MGLLDAIIGNGSGGGGLLDFLRNNALNQQMLPAGLPSDQAQYGGGPMSQAPVFAQQNAQPSPLDTAQWPAGPMGAPSQASAQMPPQQPPAVISAQPQMPVPEAAGGGLGAGFRGFMANAHTGPIGAILGGIAGLAGMGQDTPQQLLAKQNNVTAQALLQKGVDPTIVNAATVNPDLMKTLITQHFGPQTVQSLGNGYIVDKTGQIKRAYEPEDSHQVVKIGQDELGREQYGVLNKSSGETVPIKGPGANTGGALGDTNKSGAEYLATLPKQHAAVVQGMIDGTIQPPSSFAAAKPYWQAMVAAAKNVDPAFDENNWASRHKMSTDMAASGNSSIGGILSNGKSSFKHLAEYTESAADLGNASHDYPGGSAAATIQNYLGNKTFAGSDTAAKIKAINDNLGHYGQESTKFYAGTGGGVEERMNALKEMNPVTTSSEEMAAYAAKEKGLMLDRLREKEAQIRDVMGEGYLQKHPVFTPELQRDISRIDANVARLRGTPAPVAGGLPSGWTVKVH